jgi:hypothetical protein
MCRMTFAAIAATLGLSPLGAQQVPGRDLFDFPLGSIAEAPALATNAGGGFWNPATLALGPQDRFKAGISAFDAPIEQGVSAQLGTLAYHVRGGMTVGISYATAAVSDLLRTDTDPQSIGGEIPYRSSIISAIFADNRGALTWGVAFRERTASLDNLSGNAASFDVGIVLDRPLSLPFRAGASSFLLSPSQHDERATANMAIEGIIPWHPDNDLRAGFSYQLDEAGGDERYVYGSGRAGIVEIRGGFARQAAFNYSTTRLRLGVGVHYARYRVGIAREDGTAGLGASYQFFLSTVIPKAHP